MLYKVSQIGRLKIFCSGQEGSLICTLVPSDLLKELLPRGFVGSSDLPIPRSSPLQKGWQVTCSLILLLLTKGSFSPSSLNMLALKYLMKIYHGGEQEGGRYHLGSLSL